MSRTRRALVFLLLLHCLPAITLAQETGEEPRLEAYELPGDILRFADADLLMFRKNALVDAGPDLYEIQVEPWSALNGLPLCEGDSFHGQGVPVPTAPRSAFLVGKDLLVTAPHNDSPRHLCDNMVFIQDYELASATDPLGGPIPPEGMTIQIEKAKVFECIEVVACGAEGPTICDQEEDMGDWAVYRLDRDSDRTPLKIMRRERPRVADEAVIVGHPSRLPMKTEINEFFLVLNQGVKAKASVATGSSGSLLADRASGRAVGINAAGTEPRTIQLEGESCYRQCFPPVCESARVSATPTWVFAEEIPLIGLEVTNDHPTPQIEHYGPPGGPFTNPSIETTLMVSREEPAKVQWSIPPVLGALVAPGGDANTPTRGTLTGGQSTETFALELTSQVNQLEAGAYNYRVPFRDETYDTVDRTDHHLFIGIDGFSLSPDQPFFGEGPGAPSGSGKAYELTNRWPVSHLIQATGSASWIKLNGVNGSNVVGVNPESTAELLVELDGRAEQPGVYEGAIELTSTQRGELLESATIEVRMDHGRQIFAYAGPPIEIDDSGTFTIPIHVVYHSLLPVYITDADVRVDIEGSLFSSSIEAEARLRSPEGTDLLITDAIPDNRIFDDDTFPPAEPLRTFNGERPDGVWELRITPAAGEEATILSVEVRLHTTSDPPK